MLHTIRFIVYYTMLHFTTRGRTRYKYVKYGPIQKKGYDSISRHNIVILSYHLFSTNETSIIYILLSFFRDHIVLPEKKC